MLVRIVSACFAAGVPYAVGDAPDVEPSVARALIGAGRAVSYVAPPVIARDQPESPQTSPAPKGKADK